MQISTVQRYGRHLAHVAIACVATLAVTLAAAVVVLPRTGLVTNLSVVTGSMAPSIPAGSLVFVKPVDTRQIAIGDVITFRARTNSEVLVTHRVVGTVLGTNPKISFRTKGDANRAEDPSLVPDRAVVGRVVYDLPYLGSLSARAGGAGGVASLAGVVLAVVFAKRVRSPLGPSLASELHPTEPPNQPAAVAASGGAFHG